MNKIKIFAHFMYVCIYVCMTAPSYAELICSNCFSYNTACYVCGSNSPCGGSQGHNCHIGYAGCTSGVQYVNDGATSDVGAVGVSACKCPVGTYMYANRCQDCPALIENPGADWGPMPDATTSGIGAENITDCYIPASSQYEDNTGYFRYDADCSYKTSP